MKLKMRQNGFFNDPDPLNSQRIDGRNTDKVAKDVSLMDQCINSNTNTDRGHYYQNLLMHPDNFDKSSIQHKEALIKQSDSSKHSKIKKKISKKKIETLFDKNESDELKF